MHKISTRGKSFAVLFCLHSLHSLHSIFQPTLSLFLVVVRSHGLPLYPPSRFDAPIRVLWTTYAVVGSPNAEPPRCILSFVSVSFLFYCSWLLGFHLTFKLLKSVIRKIRRKIQLIFCIHRWWLSIPDAVSVVIEAFSRMAQP